MPKFPLPGEAEKAQMVINEFPRVEQAFLEPHYQIEEPLPHGTFVGLVCKCCGNWVYTIHPEDSSHHEEDCPVKGLHQEK